MGNCAFYALYFGQSLGDPFFHTLIGRVVIGAILQAVGQALHVGDFLFRVVGVLVALAVAEALHQLSGGVAEVEGNGFGGRLLDIMENRAISRVKRFDLGAAQR